MAVTSKNNLRYGSKGEDVKSVQTLLNQNGYSLNVDGSYGPKTEAAVKDYQKKTGLTVDGIVGTNTYGALTSNTAKTSTGTSKTNKTNAGSNKADAGSNKSNTGSNKTNTGTKTSTSTNKTNTGSGSGSNAVTTESGYTYQTYTPTERVESEEEKQAWATLGQLQANAPGEWTDPYRDKYMGYLNQYENRDPFSYDFNSDALYQQYKDQYIQQGQMAMMDTMGQAAAMTGGYGNSYAQTVGQQAYNQYLGQLNDKMPELYDRAYGIYQQEGQDLLNMYNAYLGLSESDYNKYLGSVDNYYKELGAAQDYATLLYNKGYGEWSDTNQMNLDIWNTNTQIGHSDHTMIQNQNYQSTENQKDRDHQTSENDKSRDESKKASAKSDLINLITSTGYNPTDSELKAAGMTRKQAEGYGKAYSDSKVTTSGNGGSGTGSEDGSYTKLEVGSTAYNTISKEIRDVQNVEQLKSLVKKYLSLGYDPAQIDALTADKYNELNPQDPMLDDPRIAYKVKGGSGGGSGTYYARQW